MLRGKIGNLIYRVRNGRQQAYPAPVKTKHKTVAWKRQGANHYRQNIEEFRAAASLGAEIYSNLRLSPPAGKPNPDALGPVFRPNAHNRIIARLKQFGDYARKCERRADHHGCRVYAHKISFPDIVRALKDQDLGHIDTDQATRRAAPRHHIRMSPIGPNHNPTAVKITGFHEAAAAIHTAGNSRLECRIHIRQSEVFTLHQPHLGADWVRTTNDNSSPDPHKTDHHTHEQVASAWIPVQIVPPQGITIDLPQWEEWEMHLTAIIVEWREVRTVGQQVKPLHALAVVRIVCLHAPATAFEEPDAAKITHWEAQIEQARQPATIPIDWETNPEAYLKAALAGMQT